MGLRTASVRRPHVAEVEAAMVMAPALTDTTQSQSFNKFNEDEIVKNYDIAEETTQEATTEVIKKFKKSEGNQLIDVKKASDNNNIITDSVLIEEPPLPAVLEASLELIMNSPMGDIDNNKMGLKTGFDSVSKVDQLLTNLNAVLPTEDNLGNGGEQLQTNVDDIMQVIKSIETQKQQQQQQDSTTPPDEFANNLFEKDLLMDDDMVDFVGNLDEVDSNSIKESQAKDILVELNKQQLKNERRLDFLRRRLNKIRCKMIGQHVSGEIVGVFENVQRTIKRAKDEQQQQQQQQLENKTDELDEKLLNFEQMKPLSYSSTKLLARKLQTTVILQANSHMQQRHHQPRYFGSGSIVHDGTTTQQQQQTNRSQNNVNNGVINVPIWSHEQRNELDKVAGLLNSELCIIQKELDSDATDSSSGGESCDEMQNYTNPHQQYLSIQKRALWKYSRDRAAIGARWQWLQSQISDLEYRIRQHTDLHKKIRSNKGAIQLGGENPPLDVLASPAPPPPLVPSTTTTTTTTPVNGYRGQLPGNTTTAAAAASPIKSSNSENKTTTNDCVNNNRNNNLMDMKMMYQCARTRPLLNFRKRKLLQVSGLHAVSKKAARPSTIRCDCTPPLIQSCALCTGRTDPMYPRDQPETMSKAERIAALDPGFHPVFSFMEDTSQTIHYEALMKTVEWQQRSSRMKSMKSLHKPSSSSSTSTTMPTTSTTTPSQQNRHIDHRTKEHRKKYGRLIKSSTMSALSAKIRGKMRGRRPGRHSTSTLTTTTTTHLSGSGGGGGGNNYTSGVLSGNNNNIGGINNSHHRKRLHSLQHHHNHNNYDGNDEEMEQIEKNRLNRLQNSDLRDAMDSPSTSPLLHMQTISGYNRKNNNNRIHSYDIDNIVIPYSVAAATRVEKLQYKEILTPKWRIADPEYSFKFEVKNNGTVKSCNTSQDSDIEDLSEESVIARHDRCEYEEKKKFLSYLKLPLGYGRQRAHKRTDSRAESSGANTPDPMSPHPIEHTNNDNITTTTTTTTVNTSPPATPLQVDDKENSNSSNSCTSTTTTLTTNNVTTSTPSLPSVSSVLRRRTVSQSRFAKERDYSNVRDENRCCTPEINEIPPYERRSFPLTEDIYEKMLKYMPENHQLQTNTRAQDSETNIINNKSVKEVDDDQQLPQQHGNNDDNYVDEKLDSPPPDSESTESAYGDGDDEDPNDPEWFEMEHSNRDRYKR